MSRSSSVLLQFPNPDFFPSPLLPQKLGKEEGKEIALFSLFSERMLQVRKYIYLEVKSTTGKLLGLCRKK